MRQERERSRKMRGGKDAGADDRDRAAPSNDNEPPFRWEAEEKEEEEERAARVADAIWVRVWSVLPGFGHGENCSLVYTYGTTLDVNIETVGALVILSTDPYIYVHSQVILGTR